MIKCSVIGPKGYTGLELIKILKKHPKAQISYLVSRNKKGKLNTDLDKVGEESDVVFLALPHRESMKYTDKLLKHWPLIIDLSGDFRFKTPAVYEKWYGVKHKAKHLIKKAVYGLAEANKQKIAKANLIANPGCYPTGAILGIAPLLKNNLVNPKGIIIDAKSGVSGAGKKAVESNGWNKSGYKNFKAYKVNQHQHAPEIKEHLEAISGKKVELNFVPHLLPIFQGLVSTIYLKPKKGVTAAKIKAAFTKYYKNQKFIRLKKKGTSPEVSDVVNTNYCDISFTFDKKKNQLIVITAIDNLLKGASGQAVQNMNICFGLPETMGLLK